jgi:adenosylmethionine-8-amino-7-oxononanoate aminotransferase
LNVIDSSTWYPLDPADREVHPSSHAVSASGISVEFADGTTKQCATSGLWNVPLGYGQPDIAGAIHDALIRSSYLTIFRYSHAWAEAAADALLTLARPYRKVLFSTSGSSANDMALRVVREFASLRGQPRRNLVVAMKRAYHGVTFGSGSLTWWGHSQERIGITQDLVRWVGNNPEDLEDIRSGLRVPRDPLKIVEWERRAYAYEEKWWQEHKHLLGE